MAVDDRPLATQTPLSQDGKSLQPGFVSPGRGLASYIASTKRASDQAAILTNFEQVKPGIWTTRGIGWTQDRATGFNGNTEFKDFSFYINPLTGVRTMLFQVADKLYSYNKTTHVETQIMTGLDVNALPTMRRFFSPVSGVSAVVYCNGVGEPQKITSPTTSAALLFNSPGVWPGTFNAKSYTKPKFCEPFGPRMVYGGFQSAATAFDILISNAGDPEKFTITAPVAVTDAVAFTYPAELGQLTSMHSHRLSNQSQDEVLICGCTDGIFMIQGNSSDTYKLVILTREMGILSNRCFVPIMDDMLFLSTAGIRTWSNLANNQVLVPNAQSDDILDFINGIDPAAVYKAHAFHNPKTQTIHFWVPLLPTNDNGKNAHALVINYNSQAYRDGNFAPQWSIRDQTSVACSIYFEGQVYGGGYTGILQQWYVGNNYNGAIQNFSYRSPLITLGNFTQKCSFRTIEVVTEGKNQKFRITVYKTHKMADGSYKREPAEPGTLTLEAPDNLDTALGTWTLGLSAFPSEHVKVLQYQPTGQATFWEIEITSAASDDVIDFIGIQYILSGGSIQR